MGYQQCKGIKKRLLVDITSLGLIVVVGSMGGMQEGEQLCWQELKTKRALWFE